MAKKVVQLHHGVDIVRHYDKTFANPILLLGVIISIIGFLLLITVGESIESLFNVYFLLIILCPIFFSGSCIVIFEFFVDFNQIEYTKEELILVSPSCRLSPTRYEYHIGFEQINEITFNHLSYYVVKFDKEAIDKLPPPIYKQTNVNYKYMIDPRLIKDQAKEKKLWKAFESLNRYYKERGKDYVVYNPPTIHYQRKLGANKIRNENHDGVIFLVKKYQGE